MNCKYCGIAYDRSDFGEYHDGGCMVQGEIKERTGGIRSSDKKNAKAKAKAMKPVATEPIVPDKPSESLTQVKAKRGRPKKKVVVDETSL